MSRIGQNSSPPEPPAQFQQALVELRQSWLARWPQALAVWSKFTRLSEPRWRPFDPAETSHPDSSSFAMIRLTDQAVIVDLESVIKNRVEGFPLEILAHEIGHHVYCPADLTDQARLLIRIRKCLPTKEHLAPLIANLYTDLLINDRLQRGAGLHMADVYGVINQRSEGDSLWHLYMRIYEILWSLPRKTLSMGQQADTLEGDAVLGARLVRSYARDWLRGATRFAMLCLPYLLENEGEQTTILIKGWLDTQNPGAGSDLPPAGLIEVEEGEEPVHPAQDPILNGGTITEPNTKGNSSTGQSREPFEYGQILKAMGLNLSDHEIAVEYYRERALPFLIRFPTRILPESTDPLPEGTEPWDIGSPLENIDWLESVLSSPRVIPNLTTLQRFWGKTEGSLPRREPLDLDLYVDCSGSMPNPQTQVSYLALAGTIISMSALRAGARVQATLWSGARQFLTTQGFVRDEKQILRILTGYMGGGTAFPIHILRDTFLNRSPHDHPAHILIISDDGVTTMFNNDEKGTSGWDIARMALEKSRGGGSMVLNLSPGWKRSLQLVRAEQEGWQIFEIHTWEELVAFARTFSKMKYQEES